MLRTLFGLLGLTVAGCASDNGQSVSFHSAEFDALIEKSQAHLAALALGHSLWIQNIEEWDLDQASGVIEFQCENGMNATAQAQIIGTFNTVDGTWLWAWDNPSISENLRQHSLTLKDYGHQHHVPVLTERKWTGSEDDAWSMTAVACLLNDAQGAYRCPAGDTLVFVTFGEVRLAPKATVSE